ncbi:hypothetical protein A9Q96_04655 [Rhodobacterales bacterium 52_120_T64]|nr:hypothetical protein A9Q96_04655 [Rhodobacterales bacterium 52_120_T64]
MIRLDLSNEPAWLDLGHGVRLHLHPLTTALMVASRNDPSVASLNEDATDEESALVFAKALARNATLDWDGVGDSDGKTIRITPEGISALLDVWPLFEAFQTKYVAKGLVLDQEKNVLSPLPNGSSAGATDTARAASPARPAGKPAKTAHKS